MAGIDITGDGKSDFSISLAQVITVLAMIGSIIGSYYTLNAKIDALEVAAKKLKENEQKYTWPAQRELEKEVRAMELEMKAFMKDLEYLKK